MKLSVRLSLVKEDYLKVIWYLEQTDQCVHLNTVANMLNVKSPTVLSMFHQLEGLDILTYDKKNGAKLTSFGKKKAEKLIRKHRLIETFLGQVLNIKEPLLHLEAENLEHAVSEQLMMHVDRFLGYPKIDPHGSIIPLSETRSMIYSLNEIEKDIEFIITKIPMSGLKKQYCHHNDLLPGSKWKIIEIEPERASYLITNGEQHLSLSSNIAEKIQVNLNKEDFNSSYIPIFKKVKN